MLESASAWVERITGHKDVLDPTFSHTDLSWGLAAHHQREYREAALGSMDLTPLLWSPNSCCSTLAYSSNPFQPQLSLWDMELGFRVELDSMRSGIRTCLAPRLFSQGWEEVLFWGDRNVGYALAGLQ